MVARRDLAESDAEDIAGRTAEHETDRENEHLTTRTVETEPQPSAWKTLAVGAVVPLGLAGAAVATTGLTKSEQVAVAAWVAVAVIGTASVISAAAISHRRTVSVNRRHNGKRHRNHHRSSPSRE